MIKHYLKVAFRNLIKYKTQSLGLRQKAAKKRIFRFCFCFL